jgi:hypothetical protein
MGEKTGFVSENIVRNAFLTIWNEYYKIDANNICKIILEGLECIK